MAEEHWNPIRLPLSQWPLSRLDEQIERAFDELLTTPWLSSSEGWLPQVDITETPEAFLIEVDLPGVGLDELRVDVDGRSVAISGSRSDRRSDSRRGVIQIERHHGSFFRKLTLREPVSSEGVEVTQEHGVIRIRLPRLRRQEPT